MPQVDVRGFNLDPNVVGSAASGFGTGQQLRSQFLQGQETQREVGRQDQFRQLTAQILDPSLPPEQRMEAQRQRSALAPERAGKVDATSLANLSTRNQALITSIVQGAAQINAIPSPEGKLQAAQERRAQLVRDNLPTIETDELINALQTGDVQGAQKMLDDTITLGQQTDILKTPAQISGSRAATKAFAPITLVNPITKEKRLVSPTIGADGQAELKAFDVPKGFEISKETAEEKRAADVLAVGSKEAQKLSAQLKLKPQIEAAVTESRALAESRGEAFTELNQMQAALPGLKGTINSLRELAPIATSTFGGRVFDTAIKESGFGSTKGATARAKFIAIINNQVLPLLKPTFGAAFTVQEGESLKATMGDPNATPEEKMAQLDAFIAQKVRDIESKQAQLQPDETGQPQDLSKLTIEQLNQMKQQAQ